MHRSNETRSAGRDSYATGAADDAGPFFFLGYAHSSRGGQGYQDPDLWISQLYDTLCEHIGLLTDLPPGSRPGFMDRELQEGQEWPWRLSNALATCRIFVPLYSKRYFKSEHCGKEWFAFHRRALNHAAANGAGRVEAIVPALWIPIRDGRFPEATRSVQFRPEDFGPLYAEHGFYGIMKVNRWRDAYDEAVYLLARRLVDAADASPVRPEQPVQYESLPPAFGGDGGTGPGDKLLRITVVAPRLDELPESRDPSYYGREAREWNPYREASVRSLADHAADLARSLSYTPDVGDLYRHEAELLGGERPSGPEVLLIDPWAVIQLECRESTAAARPAGQAMGPSRGRVESARHPASGGCGKGPVSARGSTAAHAQGGACDIGASRPGRSSLEDFGTVLPTVIAAASRQYLRSASPHPPNEVVQ